MDKEVGIGISIGIGVGIVLGVGICIAICVGVGIGIGVGVGVGSISQPLAASGIIWPRQGSIMMQMYLNNTLNSFICFSSASFWYNKIPISLLLEGPNSKFHDFFVLEPATKPPNQHYRSLEIPGHLKKTKKKYRNILGKYYPRKKENQAFRNFGACVYPNF